MKLDDSGKSLGLKPFEFFRKIFLPLNKSAIIIAFCICFVDIMKDLPLTLILRPFNFDTLATQTYEYAIEEMITKSSIYSISSLLYISSLLNRIIVFIPKDFVDNKTLSIKSVDVFGLDGVTKRKQ